MATRKFEIREFGSTTKAKLASAANAVMERSSRHRKNAALTEQHRLHFDLLCKAMDDPTLASVLDTYETDIPLEKQRQYLFANALYVNALYYHRIGAWSLTELYGHLRVICRNDVFREYWSATRHHRKSLPEASKEAELGRMMDELVGEMDRLSQEENDGDCDEWWVIGQAPAD
jgi:hypothetical protein